MTKEFLKWLKAERDEAFDLSVNARYSRRRLYWAEHYDMVSTAVEEIKATMYKEATGK